MQRYVGVRYSRIWRAAVGALAGIGVLAALVLVSPGPNLATFLLAAFMAGSIAISFGLSCEQPPAQVFRAAPRWAALAGVSTVASLGYGVAAGSEVLLLLLLVAGTSPPVAAWLGWIDPTPETKAKVKARPKRVVVEPADVELPELKPADQLSELSASELCLAWRRSFTELQRPEHWSATIDVRRAYLDELERRYPEEFAAWMASGPRAASDPGRFFNHGADR
ncbi:hypothetical protein GCM10029976_035060 [Kribbella albertanoniae]|uniref:Uncharacterized protein n=1 Tax=Kribbella albertanoniae TaxID=1266829 RepID=A0A4R4P1G6_9ACTN|nr:hypothetical protein [Kribbella albertanoniae]TDC15384.1 hypothetical protein E1261_40550 [Kribbella albertanoniae]